MNILSIRARQILDSRGNPTVEADVILENGMMGCAAVPSGASTGTNEALELRDGDPKLYSGKGVLKAIDNANRPIAEKLHGMDVTNQAEIDQLMIELDGTPNKSKLGANAILAVSLAAAKAAAASENMPFYQYIGKLANNTDFVLPLPQMNVINGGVHAAGSTDIQEFIILPVGAKNFSQAVEMGTKVFHTLANVLHEQGYGTTVGDEGGFAPHVVHGNAEALDLMTNAISAAGFQLGTEILLGIDGAASVFYQNNVYNLNTENRQLTTDQMVDWLVSLIENYPIISLEDCLDENDWSGWAKLTKKIGDKVQIVGDDIFVTNTKFIERGIKEQTANAVLIKVNQIGTLTETIAAVDMARKAHWNAIISHRSGETEDTSIAHIAVGLGTGQIKTGSLSRTDRIAKYNELLRIEEHLGSKATFAGNVFKK